MDSIGLIRNSELGKSLYILPPQELVSTKEFDSLRGAFADEVRMLLKDLPPNILPIKKTQASPDGNIRADKEGKNYDPGGKKAVEIAKALAENKNFPFITVFTLWLLSFFNVLFRSTEFYPKVNRAFLALAMRILTQGELLNQKIRMESNPEGIELLAQEDFPGANEDKKYKAGETKEQRQSLAKMISTAAKLTQTMKDPKFTFTIGIGDELGGHDVYIRTGADHPGMTKASGLKLKGRIKGVSPIIIALQDLFPNVDVSFLETMLIVAQGMYGKFRSPTQGHTASDIKNLVFIGQPNLPPGHHDIYIPFRPEEAAEVKGIIEEISDQEKERKNRIIFTEPDKKNQSVSGFLIDQNKQANITYHFIPFDPKDAIHCDAIIATGQITNTIEGATFFVLPEDINDAVVFAAGSTAKEIWDFIDAAIDFCQRNPSQKGADRKITTIEDESPQRREDLNEFTYFEEVLPGLIEKYTDAKIADTPLRDIATTLQMQYKTLAEGSPPLYPETGKGLELDLFVLRTLQDLMGKNGLMPNIPYNSPEFVLALQAYISMSGFICYEENDPRWESRGKYMAYDMANAFGTDEIYDNIQDQEVKRKITKFLLNVLENGRGQQKGRRKKTGERKPKPPNAQILQELRPIIGEENTERLWQIAGVWNVFRSDFKDANPEAFDAWKRGHQRFYQCCQNESEPSITHNTELAQKLAENDIEAIRAEYQTEFAGETPDVISNRVEGLLQTIEQKAAEETIQERAEIRFWFYFLKVYESIGAGNVYRTHALSAPKEEVTPKRIRQMERIARISDAWNRLANDMAGRLGKEDDKKEDACTVLKRVYGEAMSTSPDDPMVEAIAMSHVKKIYDWLEVEFHEALRGDQENKGLKKVWDYLAKAIEKGNIGIEVYKVKHPKRLDRITFWRVLEELEAKQRDQAQQERKTGVPADTTSSKIDWPTFRAIIQELITMHRELLKIQSS